MLFLVRMNAVHLCTSIMILSFVSCNEHDSLLCEQSSEGCAEPSHTVIRLAKPDDKRAREIAQSYGMEIVGRSFLDGTAYFLQHDNSVSKRRKREIINNVKLHPEIVSAEELRPRVRRKRDLMDVDGDVKILNRMLQIPALPFRDPLYHEQWYFNKGANGGYDMNVRGAWLAGFAGRNVSISILDDGIQRDHPDLAQNYDPEASADINDQDDDPTPQDNGDNKHGTRCAGEVAAIAQNNYCGVGVAFHAKIGGVRMLDGPVSDGVEAASLSLRQNHIDIYSASWGPEDDGKTFDGPGPLAREAFYQGIKNGRGGKGNIFVWASGNGGSRQDSCSADGYTTSVYTLSISSATFDNKKPWYLEECPSSIATTYSSANMNQPAVVTVDVPRGCTMSHTGTSASAPLAAGIIALALEANPNLTWRDMQHIVLRTANPKPLLKNPGWSTNGVGRSISNKFGYGLMDAEALVKLAQIWKTVPEQRMCTYNYNLQTPSPFPLTGNFKVNFTLEVNSCDSGTPVHYLEHVQVYATIRFGKRGDLKLTLFSPCGTVSVLLPPRPQDYNSNGFHKWPFLSVQTWGEDPRGIWTLMVESVSRNQRIGGTFHEWSLMLYGTAEPAQPTDPRYPLYAPNNSSKPFIEQAVKHIASQDDSEENMEIIGNARSVGNCHEECIGCSEPRSAVNCFTCKHLSQSLRNRAGSRCIPYCDEGFFIEGRKCRGCSMNCKTCNQSEKCLTCHGAMLLIDVERYGHFDNGHCVNRCPDQLIADYTSAIQARCVLKKNRCPDGYYEVNDYQCVLCDEACSKCHGPGVIQCDSCSPNYSNVSIGYCRPCCGQNGTFMSRHCEDCSHIEIMHNSSNFGVFLLMFGGILFVATIIFLIFMAALKGMRVRYSMSNFGYSPLSAQDSYNMNEILGFKSESDSGDDIESVQIV